jgi:septum formation protein
MADRPLILGSASPRRCWLMSEAGYEFAVVPSEAEEALEMTDTLAALVEHNASLKAKWVAARHPKAVVIGADTLVSIDGDALGKPTDLAAAKQMLQRLSGQTHEVCTGVALCCGENGERLFHVLTEVTFRKLDDGQISSYFAKVDPLDKAGAYGAQEHADDIIEKIDGSWSNVVGLPMDELARELKAFTA